MLRTSNKTIKSAKDNFKYLLNLLSLVSLGDFSNDVVLLTSILFPYPYCQLLFLKPNFHFFDHI